MLQDIFMGKNSYKNLKQTSRRNDDLYVIVVCMFCNLEISRKNSHKVGEILCFLKRSRRDLSIKHKIS